MLVVFIFLHQNQVCIFFFYDLINKLNEEEEKMLILCVKQFSTNKNASIPLKDNQQVFSGI